MYDSIQRSDFRNSKKNVKGFQSQLQIFSQFLFQKLLREVESIDDNSWKGFSRKRPALPQDGKSLYNNANISMLKLPIK